MHHMKIVLHRTFLIGVYKLAATSYNVIEEVGND